MNTEKKKSGEWKIGVLLVEALDHSWNDSSHVYFLEHEARKV